VLKYDPTFSKPNTCFLLADGRTLRCRITDEETKEVVENFPIQCREPSSGALQLRPMTPTMDHWSLDGPVMRDDVARVQLEITDVPGWVADALKLL
jgi:hypothetical protein